MGTSTTTLSPCLVPRSMGESGWARDNLPPTLPSPQTGDHLRAAPTAGILSVPQVVEAAVIEESSDESSGVKADLEAAGDWKPRTENRVRSIWKAAVSSSLESHMCMPWEMAAATVAHGAVLLLLPEVHTAMCASPALAKVLHPAGTVCAAHPACSSVVMMVWKSDTGCNTCEKWRPLADMYLQ